MNSLRRKLISMLTPKERSVSGNAPLSFRAKDGDIKSLKQYGKCVQDGTPTPDAPVDIVCNNGVLKARHQSGLPLSYTLLDYIQSAGAQYINTELTNNDVDEYYIKFKTTYSSYKFIFGNYVGENYDCTRLLFSSSNNGRLYANINAVASDPIISTANAFIDNDWNEAWCRRDTNTIYFKLNSTEEVSKQFIQGTAENSKIALFANKVGSGRTYSHHTQIANMQFKKNGILVRNFIPCRNGSNVLGMYDTVSGQFFTNQGDDNFIAGDPVDDPVVVYADGTAETINVCGKNLFDPTKVLLGYYIYRTTGIKTQSNTNFMSSDDGYIPCLPNTTYTFVGINKTDGTYSKYNTIYYFDSAKNYLGASSYEISQPTTGTTPNNCYYLQVRSNPLDTVIQNVFSRFNWQLELGSTATTYEPYYNGGTSTAADLLSVGDYKDIQDVIGGSVVRNVGVKVLDGTEDWQTGQTYNCYYCNTINMVSSPSLLFCSHFVKESYNNNNIGFGYIYLTNIFFKDGNSTLDLNSWKAWLANQYAAGTPVIVVYPLETPTTESVTPQSLRTHSGNNTIDVDSNVDPVEIEVKYKN